MPLAAMRPRLASGGLGRVACLIPTLRKPKRGAGRKCKQMKRADACAASACWNDVKTRWHGSAPELVGKAVGVAFTFACEQRVPSRAGAAGPLPAPVLGHMTNREEETLGNRGTWRPNFGWRATLMCAWDFFAGDSLVFDYVLARPLSTDPVPPSHGREAHAFPSADVCGDDLRPPCEVSRIAGHTPSR